MIQRSGQNCLTVGKIRMANNAPVVIIDSGMGNLASVVNMIKKVGGEAKVSASPDEIRGAKKLILPGVGAFDMGVSGLREKSLDVAIKCAVQENGSLLLGICLGMQLLFESSEEGEQPGLGLIEGHVRRFRLEDQGKRVPHVGWNSVKPKQNARLFESEDELRFYFAHSYHVDCKNFEDISAVTNYGYEFVSAAEKDNVMGVQFHPEKSHRFGMVFFQRYIDLE